MRPLPVLHPLFRDVILTAATSVVISMVGLFIISLVGKLIGVSALAEYLLLRRVVAWFLPVLLLGFGVSLPRYVACAVDKPETRGTYFSVAMLCGIGLAVSVGLLLNVESRLFSRLLWGSADMRYLIFPLSMQLLAQVLCSIVFGYYRGCLQIKRANALFFLSFAVIPFLVITSIWQTRSIALILTVTAALTLLCSAVFAWPILINLPFGIWDRASAVAVEMLKYGTARLPGDFGVGALLTLGPIIASHYVPIAHVAYMLLGLSILGFVGTAANPLNTVLLSKISMMLARGRLPEARRYIQLLLTAALEISVFQCLQLVVFADVIVQLWMGPRFVERILLIRILLSCIPFYLFYTSLRSVIDAASVKAYNARNIVTALFVFLALIGAATKAIPRQALLESFAGALLIALLILALLTARSLRKLYSLQAEWKSSVKPMLAGICLAGASFLFRSAERFQTKVFEYIFLQLVMTLVFYSILKHMGSPWLAFLSDNLFQRAKAHNQSSSLMQPVRERL